MFSVSLPCVPVQLHPSATSSRDSVSCLPLNYLPALECSWELPSCPACMWCLWPGLGSCCLFGSHFADWVIFTAPNRISKTHFCQVVCLFYPWDWKRIRLLFWLYFLWDFTFPFRDLVSSLHWPLWDPRKLGLHAALRPAFCPSYRFFLSHVPLSHH